MRYYFWDQESTLTWLHKFFNTFVNSLKQVIIEDEYFKE